MTAIKSYEPDVDVPDYVAIGYRILADYAESFDPISDLCRTHGIGAAHFYRALATDKRLAENWRIAQRIRAQHHADEALRLTAAHTDDWDVDNFGRYSGNSGLLKRVDLQVRTHMMLAARLDPDTFGDRTQAQAPAPAAAVQLIIAPSSEAAAAWRERQRVLVDGAPPSPIDPSGMEPRAAITPHVNGEIIDVTENKKDQ